MSKLTVMMAALAALASCKKSRGAAPHVSPFKPLAPGPTATLDPPEIKSEFPHDPPAIVVWRGGGQPPRTEVSLRIWKGGIVRFACGRSGHLDGARVDAMIDAFIDAGWGKTASSPAELDTTCISTSVQFTNDAVADRRNSACATIPDDIADAVAFVTSVVGPDPCGPNP